MKKIVIYTALFGNYDQLIDPIESHDQFDFIYFSEKKIDDLSIWQHKKPHKELETPAKSNRYHKMQPHIIFKDSQYEHSVYIDSNIFITNHDFFDHVLRHVNNCSPLALVPHPIRYCCYQELANVLDLHKISDQTYTKTQEFLFKNFPHRNYGLYAAYIIFRHHTNKTIQALCNDWWDSLTICNRDQVLLPYFLYRHKIQQAYFFHSPLFNAGNHSSCLLLFHLKQPVTYKNKLSQKENYKLSILPILQISQIIEAHASSFLHYSVSTSNPRTFNDHINALKQQPPSKLMIQLSDKLGLKQYLTTIPFDVQSLNTLATGTSFDALLSNDLPQSITIKSTHHKQLTWAIADKKRIPDTVKKEINDSLNITYGEETLEPNHVSIPRLLFAEEPPTTTELTKTFTTFIFKGDVRLIGVNLIKNSLHTQCFYTRDWQRVNLNMHLPEYKEQIPQPKHLSKMIDISHFVGKDFSFLTIKFMVSNNKLYVLGLDFFPGAGLQSFSNFKHDYFFGQLFNDNYLDVLSGFVQ